MRELNIRKVFDLRSDREMKKNNAYMPNIKDVDVVWTPVFKTEDYSDTTMAESVLVASLPPATRYSELKFQCRRYKRYSSDKVEVSNSFALDTDLWE